MARVASSKVEVPPAGAVGDEDDRAPSGDHSGWKIDSRRAARDHMRLARRAVGIDRREIERRAVPRHVGMVPGEPDQPAAVRRQPRRAEEIVAAGEDAAGVAARPRSIATMVLTGSPSAVWSSRTPIQRSRRSVDHAVGVAPLPVARGGAGVSGCGAAAPVRWRYRRPSAKLEKMTAPSRTSPRAAAIFVHAGADVEGAGVMSVGAAPSAGAHDHDAALLLRPPFQPVDVAAVEPHLRQRIDWATIRSEVIGDFHEP